jgi:uncharacterized protein
MKDRAHDVRRLDVARLAAEGARIGGELTPADLPRLCADTPLVADEPVRWQLSGAQRHPAGAEPEVWLQVEATARVVQTCQRCLQPMPLTLTVDRPIRFVAGEDVAERLDEQGEDDVLALPPRGLDGLALIEDELILALPLVPRHERCPQPLPTGRDRDAPGDGQDAPADVRENPFAALAALQRPSARKR